MDELSPQKKRLYALITVAFMLVLFELMAWAVAWFLGRQGWIFIPPVYPDPPMAYAEYLAKRDPVLGWPAPAQLGTKSHDAIGARPDATAPAGAPCAYAFGDSFVYGAELGDDAQIWSSLAGQELGCRVANFGVAGYGTDQAFMRYRLTPHAPSPVILGHLSENIQRNINRNRDLLFERVIYALKPRFVLSSTGALQLVPLPALTEREYRRSTSHEGPPFVLENEAFQEGGTMAYGAHFPHIVGVFTALRDYRARAQLASRPVYHEFYAPGHPHQAFEITLAIMSTFAREAEARGDRPVILLLPTRDDIAAVRAGQGWTYAPLVKALTDEKIPLLDFGPPLAKILEGRDPKPLFQPEGHYGVELQVELGRFVKAWIGK